MEGQRPIVDTFLGYNLMWFYPLVALFNLTGPDYVAMRIFFFAICALTAVLGFTIVRQATRQGWLALLVGVLLVLVPGMLFRNYMGFIGVISILLLIKGFVLDAGSRL
jgi:dolichyl-phosphate-mannose--protein O-mannosyl transferase